jgi:hypothetical protein
MTNINRRKFIKKSALAMMSYSMFGCAANLSAKDYDDKYVHSPNYYNGKFKNLIETSEGPKPGTSLKYL